MGVHTGDSITVAPAQTLTDKEYQIMRDASLAIMREIGVDTGGSNVQFAVNPANGRMIVIEMNPRVSRSSALASKATGFPIAKIAAKLAVGLTLDEIPNDITKETPASFEPAIDYVVTNFPRFAFEKFPEADSTLMTQMKSVGEAMAIGRTFKESLQKALRSLEIDSYGFEPVEADLDEIKEKIKVPSWDRMWYIAHALRLGASIDELYDLTWIDRWFLFNMKQIIDMESEIVKSGDINNIDLLMQAKEYGFSDRRLAELLKTEEKTIRDIRSKLNYRAAYKMVDTCAAEFKAYTPYMYSTYEKPFYSVTEKKSKSFTAECEANPTDNKKIIILGSGPNRIGQGIEFDYCCVHAVFALKELGYETIMVNCNPETVSTDYDTADRLYFEPLTLEDTLNIIRTENPIGVIVQFGGQTPLKLAVPLEKEGVKILGTSPDSIDRAEDRKRFKEILHKLDLKQPESGTAMSVDEAIKEATRIGYPVMVRPSYVLGGRAMEIVYDEKRLNDYMRRAVSASPEHPILVDKYLEDAIEVDVDALSDGSNVIVGGIMEHIEEAGIHSGDSACSLPPYSLSSDVIDRIKQQSKALAKELNVIGLMNVQFAVKDDDIYILEVNPRASRTIPYVSKSIGVPLAKMAAKVMAGKTLEELGLTKEIEISHYSVKEAVFPFDRFSGVDTLLGPEMKSTGEVMGIDRDFGRAYAKSQTSANNPMPLSGSVLISVKDKDKPFILSLVKILSSLGFSLMATKGTSSYLRDNGLEVKEVNKLKEGRPNIVDHIKNKEINLIINTVSSAKAHEDSFYLREAALQYNVTYTTTVAGARAASNAIEVMLNEHISIRSIQEYHTK
jgi:carbamoyl-phosphate synthase large subunit